jgi:hypothetical protein
MLDHVLGVDEIECVIREREWSGDIHDDRIPDRVYVAVEPAGQAVIAATEVQLANRIRS